MGKIVDKKTLSELFGISEKSFSKYQKHGLPFKRSGRGNQNAYDTEVVFQWLVNKELSGKLEGGSEIDTEHERGRLTRAQADAKELDNAERRKELAPVDLLEWVLSKACSQISAVLETIPLNVKRRVPQLSANAIELIKKEIVRCQNIAASAEINLDEFAEEAESEYSEA